jgi:hydroxymethylglutaryl-CoA reductase (NADPH)
MEATSFANVPMAKIGPIRIKGMEVNDDVVVQLATYETTLWPSTNRGAIVSRACNGINAIITDERMTRSIALQAKNATVALNIKEKLHQQRNALQEVTQKTGRFVKLVDLQVQIIGNILFIRFEFTTGDASGHNMVTKASDQLVSWLLANYPQLSYISVSGNYCVDKKVSAVNAIRGRGKKVIAEIVIPRDICIKLLKTTPEKIVELNIKKNYLGSIAAGSLMSANAHFANMLLAFYLATGQDAANIVEGSQGIVTAELQEDNLYFSITAPNIIVGTVGNGKHLAFAKENLELMGCTNQAEPGINSRRLAIICGAAILCGELSLLAALTNPGELVTSHMFFERNNR